MITKTLDQMQKELEQTLHNLQENKVSIYDFFKVQQIILDNKQEEIWNVIPDVNNTYYN